MAKKEFYCITSNLPGVVANPNFLLLKEACRRRGVPFVHIRSPQGSYAFEETPILNEGGLYRLNVQTSCGQFTYAISCRNPQLKTLSRPNAPHVSSVPWGETLLGETANINVIPSLYNITPLVDDSLINKIEQYLGGFPVILKQMGGSHGTGVMLIDSALSLKTLLPHLVSEDNGVRYIFRKFIKEAENYRVIVLNETCISVIKYLPQKGDIRTNATDTPSTELAEITEEWKALAIRAVKNKGVVFGGLDLLIARDGMPYLAEVNTPCNFSRAQHLTGDDIAGALVDYLCRI